MHASGKSPVRVKRLSAMGCTMGYSALQRRLDKGGVVILDGGTGTELERRGVPMDAGSWCGIASLDHLVLTVADLEATLRFYRDGLGMTVESFGADGVRKALHFGDQKINLHEQGKAFEPKAERPTPGSADLCFLTDQSVDELAAKFEVAGHRLIEGPVERSGATGPILSIYLRDPDGNLIEIAQCQRRAGPST